MTENALRAADPIERHYSRWITEDPNGLVVRAAVPIVVMVA